LGTEVVSAVLSGDGASWKVVSKTGVDGPATTGVYDYLVVCNGIFSQPLIPDYEGASDFAAGGGRICHTSEFKNLAGAAGKHVIVVGYGKSSCDVAQAVSATAASTTVVARHLIWKVPKFIMNALNYKFLLLTRMGEGLFKYIRLSGFESFLHGAGKPVRDSMLGQVQWAITTQLKLNKLGLNPGVPFDTIARSTVSLVTDGFYESVGSGKIKVAKGASIKRLVIKEGRGTAELSTGETLPADIVICGTGWNQSVPFLDAATMAKITDASGNFLLYRSMIPIGVPRLAFNGYNSSFFSQLNAEIGALWLADVIAGKLTLPPAAEQRRVVEERLAWMEARTDGKHSKGTNIIPFSVHHIDELLNDLRLPLGALTRFKQWLMPIDPGDFAGATKALLRRHGRA
jgi:cation diffusion facilitator CzcD-associated flavoprotein CzcO